MGENNAIRIAEVTYAGDYTLRLRWAKDMAHTVDRQAAA